MKLKNFIKILINSVGMAYPQLIVKREFKKQNFTWLNERPIEFEFLFRKIVEIWPKTILDVGTGITALPHMLRNCGMLVTAIDNIQDYWPEGMVNRHFFVINDDIRKTKLNQKFDFICCISVLEHIKDHKVAIDSMANLLNPGGVLVLTCPYGKKYVPNVYKLSNSWANREEIPFITQSFSDAERTSWLQSGLIELIDEEYWRYSDGNFWTCGQILNKPIKVSKQELHQLCCMAFRKKT